MGELINILVAALLKMNAWIQAGVAAGEKEQLTFTAMGFSLLRLVVLDKECNIEFQRRVRHPSLSCVHPSQAASICHFFSHLASLLPSSLRHRGHSMNEMLGAW